MAPSPLGPLPATGSRNTWSPCTCVSQAGSAGSPEQADAALERILEVRGDQDQDRAVVLFARSQMAVRTRNLGLAYELAQQAVEQSPERIEFLTGPRAWR